MPGDSKVPMGHPDHVSERTIAITGGDAGYFDLMKDCIGSLRATPEGRALSLGVLDCGLTEEQRAWCRAQGATLVVPRWLASKSGHENALAPNTLDSLRLRLAP